MANTKEKPWMARSYWNGRDTCFVLVHDVIALSNTLHVYTIAREPLSSARLFVVKSNYSHLSISAFCLFHSREYSGIIVRLI